MQNSKILSHFK